MTQLRRFLGTMLLGAWVCVVVSIPDDLIVERADAPLSADDARSAFECRAAVDPGHEPLLLSEDAELDDAPALLSIKSVIVHFTSVGFDRIFTWTYRTHITIDVLISDVNEHAPRAPPHWL